MSESQPSTPLPNDPAARTPDGTLKDAGTPLATQTSSTTPETKVDEPATSTEPATKSPAPDTYTFTPPDGKTYDQSTIDAATPVFRELGLNQAQADKLVEFWNSRAQTSADAAKATIAAMGEKWMGELKSDPDIGGKLDTVKADMGRAFDSMVADGSISRRDVDEFKFAMDLSMVGNNRAFAKVFNSLAKSRVEGKSVSGTGPSTHGQNVKGVTPRPGLAAAMYPNLPSSSQ